MNPEILKYKRILYFVFLLFVRNQKSESSEMALLVGQEKGQLNSKSLQIDKSLTHYYQYNLIKR